MNIPITVNGDPREVAEGTSVAGLLAELALTPERTAVERNGCIVRKSAHDSTRVHAGDRIEIVTLVGGG